jgi:hypothetical protein
LHRLYLPEEAAFFFLRMLGAKKVAVLSDRLSQQEGHLDSGYTAYSWISDPTRQSSLAQQLLKR